MALIEGTPATTGTPNALPRQPTPAQQPPDQRTPGLPTTPSRGRAQVEAVRHSFEERRQARDTLLRDFTVFDTAGGRPQDDLVSHAGLEEVASGTGAYTREQRDAARVLLEDREFFEELDVGRPGAADDELIGKQTVQLYPDAIITPDQILDQYQVSLDPDGTVMWEPAWPASIFTEPRELTATEARMLDDIGWLAQQDFKQIAEHAFDEADQRFVPEDQNDNHNDAFRHAYWNALLTQRFGEEWARDYTTAHERITNPAAREAMDLWNNEVGRRIAVENPDASPEELADLVEAAVRNGEMVVVGADGSSLVWSNQIPEGGHTGDANVDAPVDGHDPNPAPNPDSEWGGGYDPGNQPEDSGTTTSGN